MIPVQSETKTISVKNYQCKIEHSHRLSIIISVRFLGATEELQNQLNSSLLNVDDIRY